MAGDPVFFTIGEVLGYTSVLCWIIVFTPQLYENHKRKSGESLSVLFLYIWLVADILALIGLILCRLEKFQIVLTVYYTIVDSFLIGQVYYYRRLREDETIGVLNGERTPLLHGKDSSADGNGKGTGGIGGGGAITEYESCSTVDGNVGEDEDDCPDNEADGGSSSAANRTRANSQVGITQQQTHIKIGPASPLNPIYLMHLLSLLSTAMAAPSFPHTFGVNMASEGPGGVSDDLSGSVKLFADICGYTSAILYIGSRIPQIYKNYQLKSCEGLSVWLFILSVAGNFTYVLSILFKFLATEDEGKLHDQIPYLLGSGGTLIFDITIFLQFFYYQRKNAECYQKI